MDKDLYESVSRFEKTIRSFLWSIVDDVEDDEANEYEYEEKCYVYFIENEFRDLVKIGISVSPERRLYQLQTACGDSCHLMRTFEYKSRRDAMDAESWLHSYYSNSRKAVHGRNKPTEWFDGAIREHSTYGCVPLYSFKTVDDIESVRRHEAEKDARVVLNFL